jgi:hypothetical protein
MKSGARPNGQTDFDDEAQWRGDCLVARSDMRHRAVAVIAMTVVCLLCSSLGFCLGLYVR